MEEMEIIDIKELLYTLWNKKVIVFICLFLGIIAGLVYTIFLLTPMYQSTTTLVLSSANASDDKTGITTNDVTLNSKLVSTYSEIIKTRTVAEEVIKSLGLSMSESDFMDNVSISSKNNTEVLAITVSNTNAKTAADIANKIAEVFSNKVKEIYKIENVSIIDQAIEAKSPYNVTFTKNMIISAMGGIVLGFVIIFVTMLFDTTVKNQEDIERMLGVPVLAVIPKVDSKE